MAVRNLNHSTERVPIGSIEPHPENPNRGNVAGIRGSIETVGWFGHVICQLARRRILIGEHRWLSLQAEGAEEVDVLWLDCDDETAAEVMIADNEWARQGRNDENALFALLSRIFDERGTTEHLGFDDERFRELEARMGDVDDAEADDADEEQEQHEEQREQQKEQFREYDDDGDEEYCCPSCGYEWSGRPRAR